MYLTFIRCVLSLKLLVCSQPPPTLHMQHSDNRYTVYMSNIQHHFGDNDLQELFKQVRGSVCVCVCVCVCSCALCMCECDYEYACAYPPYIFVVHQPVQLFCKSDFFIFFCVLDFQCGPLKEVRLIKNRAGKSKGFAYVEYLSEVKLIFIFIFKSRNY